jgi:ADP-ribose pyrophosphatase YjhB (NUDIX family)
MLKIYNAQMEPIGKQDKKIVHQKGLWHKVFGGVLYNPLLRTIYFQTIYPKESYTFEREDYIDFAVGGHVEDDETIVEAGKREITEELGFDIDEKNWSFLGIRICDVDLSETYKIKEFQHFYALKEERCLKDMDFSKSDGEVKSIIEVNIDDFLKLLTRAIDRVSANEVVLDKNTRESTYFENITLLSSRIVPDYFKDKSILETFLAVKNLIG